MCGGESRGKEIAVTTEEGWDFKDPCDICRNTHHMALVKCEVIAPKDGKRMLKVIGVVREWSG